MFPLFSNIVFFPCLCVCVLSSLPTIFCCLRYFFPPLDPPRAGSRYGHLLPPSSLVEHCDAELIQPQQQAPLHRLYSRALLPLPETDGQWWVSELAKGGRDVVGGLGVGGVIGMGHTIPIQFLWICVFVLFFPAQFFLIFPFFPQ